MRGRSPEQVAAYEEVLGRLASLLLSGKMTAGEIRDALSERRDGEVRRPTAATVHARIEALRTRGYAVRRRKKSKDPGCTGQRERLYWIEETGR